VTEVAGDYVRRSDLMY